MTNREAAVKIIKKLRKEGFEALFAGGCVRDMLLGRRANDYDVATSAKPKEVARLFRRTLKVGAKFGVVIVLLDNQQVEVATFRTEKDYPDGRHPAGVVFSTAAEDAQRRDFTVNGMFYDPIEKKTIDYVNGRADLKRKIIRTIGDPSERFGEDYLRMLRAVRFSGQLNFKIEPKTMSAICRYASKINDISGERKCSELEGMLVCVNRAQGAGLLIQTSLAENMFEGFIGQEAEYGTKALSFLPKRVDFPLALSAFFAGFETGLAMIQIKSLKPSSRTIKHVKFLLNNRGRLLNDEMSLSELKLILAEPYFDDLYEFQKSIQRADQKSLSPLIKIKKRANQLKEIELKPKPLLNGHELMNLGLVPGPKLGQLSKEMYIAQLEGIVKTKAQAKEWVRNWLIRHKRTH